MVNAGPAVYISPSGPNPIMVQVIDDILYNFSCTEFTLSFIPMI